jgi:hypothetical protein
LAIAELLDGAPREVDRPDIEQTAEQLRHDLERRYPGARVRMRETGRYLRAVVGTYETMEPEHGRALLGDRAWRLIEVTRSIPETEDGIARPENRRQRCGTEEEG